MPQLVVSGIISRTRAFKRRQETDSGPAGELLGHNVDIDTDGGPVAVTYWASDAPAAPNIGEYVAVVTGVQEGARGADLVYVRDFNANDLDQLASNLHAKKAS